MAAAAARSGVREHPLLAALQDIASQGSDRGGVIDRALELCGIPARPDLLAGLVAAFRGYRPAGLAAYPGVPGELLRLREILPVACITDGDPAIRRSGDPAIQRAKLAALRLEHSFGAIVISDELRRQFRKPHPEPFLAALRTLGAAPADAVHVGDRPERDVAGPHQIGMRAIRVRTGEYAAAPDGSTQPDLSFDNAVHAMEAVREAAAR